MSKYLIPSIEEIKAAYNEIIPLMKELKTKDDVIAFEKKHKVTMEINYDLAKYYNENDPIEVIRCEHWKDLDYIYVPMDGSAPHFDVWCDFMDYDFIDGTTIEYLEKKYVEGIKWMWNRFYRSPKNLKEIICVLKQHGIQYDDIIEIYGFDENLIEEFKDENEQELEELKDGLIKIQNALEKLSEAWEECEFAFDNFNGDCNDYIVGSKEAEDEYPFHLSFDEIMVVDWCYGAIQRIENDLKTIERKEK